MLLHLFFCNQKKDFNGVCIFLLQFYLKLLYIGQLNDHFALCSCKKNSDLLSVDTQK